ncbi:MAG: histidinol phosphatase, partial [Candidatus Parvarchaeota archaeon]|nr:histidinol phosphatase [Candidatus Rehaiarchaeum fermentans]
NVVISFVDRPSFFFESDNFVYGYLPYKNSFIVGYEYGKPFKVILGDYMKLQKPTNPSFFIAYSYMFSIKNIFFGVRPIAISNIV